MPAAEVVKPQRSFWIVDVNTVSGSHASFDVYVICINAATSALGRFQFSIENAYIVR